MNDWMHDSIRHKGFCSDAFPWLLFNTANSLMSTLMEMKLRQAGRCRASYNSRCEKSSRVPLPLTMHAAPLRLQDCSTPRVGPFLFPGLNSNWAHDQTLCKHARTHTQACTHMPLTRQTHTKYLKTLEGPSTFSFMCLVIKTQMTPDCGSHRQ